MDFEALKSVIVDELEVEAKEVTMEATFADDLGADSLDLFEMVMAIEDEFGVKIPTEELGKMKTVQDAANYIEAREME